MAPTAPTSLDTSSPPPHPLTHAQPHSGLGGWFGDWRDPAGRADSLLLLLTPASSPSTKKGPQTPWAPSPGPSSVLAQALLLHPNYQDLITWS